jgi:hypothetical protein
MRWHPASGLGVVVLGNATYAPAQRLGTGLLDALLAGGAAERAARRPGASPAPATGSMVEATAAARDDVTRLIGHWDDDLAGRLLAMNVDLDEPLASRRRELARIVESIGPLEPDDAPITSLSPAHCSWWLRGPGGRVRVEIRLSPELPPRVQTLAVTAVPEAAAVHRRIADLVATRLGRDDPRWPDDVPLEPPLSAADLTRLLRVAAAWAGPSLVASVLAGDGQREATFRLDGERADLQLAITADPATGTVAGLTLTPAPA